MTDAVFWAEKRVGRTGGRTDASPRTTALFYLLFHKLPKTVTVFTLLLFGVMALVGYPCHYALMGMQSSTRAPGVSVVLSFRMSPERKQNWLLIGFH